MRVASVNVSFTDDGTKLVGGIDWTLVHIYLDAVPVAFVNQLSQVDFTHHGWHYVTVLQMEVIVRSVKVGRHHCDIVGTVLQVVRFAHLQSSYLGDGILLVSILQR